MIKARTIVFSTVIALCVIGAIGAYMTITRQPPASADEQNIKQSILRRLKDPDSAKFGTITLIDANQACARVNAKTEMGGYAGEQSVHVIKSDGEWLAGKFFDDLSHAECVEISAKKKQLSR